MQQGDCLFRHTCFLVIIGRGSHRAGDTRGKINHFGLSRKRCLGRIIEFAGSRRRMPRPKRETMAADPEQAARDSFHRPIADHFGNAMCKRKHRPQRIRDRIHVFRNKRGDPVRGLPVLFPTRSLISKPVLSRPDRLSHKGRPWRTFHSPYIERLSSVRRNGEYPSRLFPPSPTKVR